MWSGTFSLFDTMMTPQFGREGTTCSQLNMLGREGGSGCPVRLPRIRASRVHVLTGVYTLSGARSLVRSEADARRGPGAESLKGPCPEEAIRYSFPSRAPGASTLAALLPSLALPNTSSHMFPSCQRKMYLVSISRNQTLLYNTVLLN